MIPAVPDIDGNLQQVRERIRTAAARAGTPLEHIRLIAVSKYMPQQYIEQAVAAGHHCFGENTVQDARTKQSLIDDPANEWHFIGHLQTNKAKYIPGSFDWLHTLDNLKLAVKLSDRAVRTADTLNVLIQVNIANDPDKHGLMTNDVFPFIETLLADENPGIKLKGLMTIGQKVSTPDQRRSDFSGLRELGLACAERFGADSFTELSMGMSGDFEAAIEEGATMVRVGTAIFGPRPSTPG